VTRAYYNEIESFAAQWLRNLIAAGHIAPGDVDERSIEDVRPSDVAGYAQCHWFAGIGIWSAALRGAGWPDARPIWTGSCPCQPFSQGGKGGGFADERHLWPAWFWLIEQCRPRAIAGEQVASSGGVAWLDLVSTDLEGAGYTIGPTDTCAAGFGAPQIRQRLYWVADAAGERRGETGAGGGRSAERAGDGRELGRVADPEVSERGRESSPELDGRGTAEVGGSGVTGRMADAGSLQARRATGPREEDGGRPRGDIAGSGATGFWSSADWLPCRDGKARPVEPGTSPLATRHPGDVGRLRAYGNSLCLPQATEFVRAYKEATP